MTFIHSDGKSILPRSVNIWRASYWQLLVNSKVPGSSPGGVTDDFFLSFISGLQVLSFGEK